ncbi:MAG: HEAT repeat domain-containing protein [Patulibacter minatonensis]
MAESKRGFIEGADGKWIEFVEAPLTPEAKAYEAERQALVAAIESKAAPLRRPLLAELAAAGYAVENPWELAERKDRYRDAVPILLKWLPLVEDNPTVAEEVVRALGRPWNKEAVPALLEQVRTSPFANVRWAAANGLEFTANHAPVASVAALALDVSIDPETRVMLLRALAKQARKSDEARAAIVTAVADPEIGGHALQFALKYELQPSRESVRRHLDDDRSWARKDAKKLLDQLDS